VLGGGGWAHVPLCRLRLPGFPGALSLSKYSRGNMTSVWTANSAYHEPPDTGRTWHPEMKPQAARPQTTDGHMKIGIVYTAFNCLDQLRQSLPPWFRAKKSGASMSTFLGRFGSL